MNKFETSAQKHMRGETIKEVRFCTDAVSGQEFIEIEFFGQRIAVRAAVEHFALYLGGLPPIADAAMPFLPPPTFVGPQEDDVKWTCPECVNLGAFDKRSTTTCTAEALAKAPKDWTPACPRCKGAMEIS